MSRSITRPTGHQDARWVGGKLYFATPEPISIEVAIKADTRQFTSAMGAAMARLA